MPFRQAVPTFENTDNLNFSIPSSVDIRPADIAMGLDLKMHLKELFLTHINVYYNFVDSNWLLFSDNFPENDTVLQLLYSAIFAAASHLSPQTNEGTTAALLKYAEKLVAGCCNDHLCLPVVKALLILAWYKHSTMRWAQGYMYQCWGPCATINFK
jgi:hypothetical protein